MHTVGVVGPPEERRAAVEALVARLDGRGRVGVVTGLGWPSEGVGADYRTAGAAVAYGVEEGGWVAAGEDADLDDALDRLAADCDYAVVEGRPDAALAQVAIGEIEHAGETLDRAGSAAEIDVETVVAGVEETEPRETLESLVRTAKRDPDSEFAGAIATFTGRVRPKEGPDDDYTEHLEFEKYDDVAERKMAAIREDIESREGVYRVVLHHKTGVVEAETDIVHVVVLAGHRREAFDAVEDGIDRLKEEVPLFKKEVTVAEEFWAHERDGQSE
ncbi:MAG: molybdopterin synthase [Halobacteriaceae archaeon]